MRLPFVSILLPFCNEEKYIQECLQSLLDNGYPSDLFEILAIDGMSSDHSVRVVQSLMEKYPQIRLLKNEKKYTPAALNLGVENAAGEILVWVGAHALYEKDYIKKSVVLLLDKKAASVGGIINPVGHTKAGEAIACAVRNPFGVGNAYYRFASKAGWVDTVFGGCWRKEDVMSVGGFDESWLVNQDYEFNFRLRERVGKIYLSPEIRCTYFVRDSYSLLARQYFRYGFWRVRTLVKHPKSLNVRQLVAPVFVLVLALFLILGIMGYSPIPLLTLLLVYFAAAAVARLLDRECQSSLFLVILAFWLMHMAWGTGFLVSATVGIFRILIGKRFIKAG